MKALILLEIQLFLTIYAASSCWQIKMHKDDLEKTLFTAQRRFVSIFRSVVCIAKRP